jgi:hypothetical protein
MTTLKSFAYQFIDDFSGGGKTTDSKLDPRDVILKTRQLLNEVMNLKFFEKYNEGDRSAISMYISTYTLTLEHDSERNIAFVTIPEVHHSLPYNRGVHRAWLKKDSDEGEFNDIVLSQHPGIGAKLRAGQVAGIRYAYMEGLKLVLRQTYVDADDPQEVFVQLIIAAPDSIGESDPLPCTPEQLSEVMRRLRAFYVPVPQDLVINGNPNK